MKPFVERLVNEHAELQVKIIKLTEYIDELSEKGVDNPFEFALLNLQLSYMGNYKIAIEKRLGLYGVAINENGEYWEKVGELCTVDIEVNEKKDDKKDSSDNN